MVMKRRPKKTRKYLGTRSHGRGNTKNRRGAGCRGGRGMAGIDKHKWSWAMNVDKNYYSKIGFANPTRKTVDAVNLYEINQMALKKKLEKKGDKYQFEFDGKVLATGSVTVPLSIRAASWSKNVEKKLKESGGEISGLEQ
ncbi:50S ribosomal protein L15 [Candidatus Micrarchaeota archaeon]|nr:50S ribosomal protein L15 [Candidatus Micrarchaeota archaeon]